jgi:hypothetical protein
MELKENQVIGIVDKKEGKVKPTVITMLYQTDLRIRVSSENSDFPIERNGIQFVLPGFEALLRR